MKFLDTFDELKNWQDPDTTVNCLIDYKGQQFQEVSGAPVSGRSFARRNKVLFCHDMRGGYLDDALSEVNENIHAYRFYHWSLIDIFCYFSHHFITIPPLGWIYHSHRNAVQCLGTFIIEGHDNENFRKLLTPGNIEIVAQKLTKIKNFYHFEGWLINLECHVKHQATEEAIGKILWFLARLVQLGNEVYWYDAITTSGDLVWQNGLTKQNKPFYDICGNIFLNYCWNEATLNKSVQLANGNLHQVFVGIDCFGRGCPGGGKLNCNIALELIESVFKENESKGISNFSIALFAPGWCHEKTSIDEGDRELDDITWLFYNLMEKYLQPWLDGRTVFRQLPELLIDQKNSFNTNFDIGQGVACWKEGVEVSRGDYNWLMDQNLIPTGRVSDHNFNIKIKILPYRKGGYNGHSCMIMVAECSETVHDLSCVPITIELFRVGCLVTRHYETSLLLVLGHDVDSDPINLWSSIRIVLHFSDGGSDTKSVAFTLGEIRVRYFISTSSNIDWNIFEICSLMSALGTASASFTIRKISLEIVKDDALQYMVKKNIYLGQLALTAK